MSSPSVKLFNTSRIDANDENVIPVAPLPEPQEIDWIYWRRKITPTLSPPEWFGDGSQSSRPSFITNRDAAEIFKTCIVSLNECTEFKSERATNTVVLLLRAMARRHAFDEAGLALRQGTMGVSIRTILFHWFRASLVETIHPLNSDRTQEVRNRARSARTSLIEGPQYRDALGSVHYWCDWLKSIIIVNWDGKAVVNRWDIAGAALEQLDLTYQIFRFPEFQWLQARITFDDILQFLDQFRGLSTNPNYRHILQYHGLHHISYFEVVFRAGNASQALTNYYQNEKYVYGYISKLRGILTEPLVKNVLQCFKSSSEPLLNINIRRTSMLKDTFQQFWGRDSHELHKPVKVTYVSETGADQGGLTNDLFRRVFDEASNMNGEYYPVFLQPILIRVFSGIFQCLDDSNMYWFQPKSTVPPEFYESLGIIMAVAIFNGIPAPIEFPKVFYFSVIEKHATVHADADPLLSDGWPGQMTHLFRSNLNELGLDFSYSFKGGDGQIWSLDMMTARSIDDAVLGSVESEDVTSLNQDQYRVLYQEWTWKLSVLPQLNAFIKGFNTIFPAKDLNWMSPSMLQHIVSGNAVSVEELKERTEYGTFNAFIYDPTHPVITMFWETLGSFSGEQFKQFLRFVFANEKLPRLSGRWMTIVPYLSNEVGMTLSIQLLTFFVLTTSVAESSFGINLCDHAQFASLRNAGADEE